MEAKLWTAILVILLPTVIALQSDDIFDERLTLPRPAILDWIPPVDSNNFAQINLFNNNPRWTPDGHPIIQGDIVIDPVEAVSHKKGARPFPYRWYKGIVPYEFHPSVELWEQKVIKTAMQYWEEHTCLKFRKKMWYDPWFLRFRTDTAGCWSFVGRQLIQFGGQDISIGKGCATRDVVVHEIGHGIGFFHEQSRSDRDGYILILWDNIIEGMEPQFEEADDMNEGVKYDFTSIMHYNPYAFSKAVFEKNTIVTRDPHFHRLLGKREGLSFRDAKLANSMYSCSDECPNKGSTACLNGGYMAPYRNDGRSCDCVCPPGTTGKFCEAVTGIYYELSPCGGDMYEEGVIETPNYPERKNPNESCSWIIQSPPGKKVQLKFEGFEFAPRLNRSSHRYHNKCVWESVEIRTADPYRGDVYCGTDIAPGTTLTSAKDTIVMIIIANDSQIGKGLRANVKFIPAMEEEKASRRSPRNP